MHRTRMNSSRNERLAAPSTRGSDDQTLILRNKPNSSRENTGAEPLKSWTVNVSSRNNTANTFGFKRSSS